jgi:hypothetical protein
MNERNGSENDRAGYQGTSIAIPAHPASHRSQVQPTRTAQPPQSASRRNQPHLTGYDRELHTCFTCRCGNPTKHGDAWTPVRGKECYDGIPRRDTTGTRITWEEEMHRALDILGKDYASANEMESTIRQVYNADTARAMEKIIRNGEWAQRRGLCRTGLPHDAIWHGRTNPKGCDVLLPPEHPDAVFIGATGGYRPGPSASAQGTRLQGRSTTLGQSWGASEVNRRGSSTQNIQPQGRSTTLGHFWGTSQVKRGGSSTHGRR